jgi:hypothetical protein
MPIFHDDTAESFRTAGSGFHFSGTSINNLGASEYTLVGVACDRSGSVIQFAAEIEKCLRTALESCQNSPRVDNLLVRLLAFNHMLDEQHGFRPLRDCPLAGYDGFLCPGGMTALYDASVNLVDSLATYGRTLMSNDYTVNGLAIVITDGCDNMSKLTMGEVSNAVQRATQAESLESLITVLIGINIQDPDVSRALNDLKSNGGFTQYVEAKDASPKTLARVAGFISKSISSQSQSIGSGAASLPITF